MRFLLFRCFQSIARLGVLVLLAPMATADVVGELYLSFSPDSQQSVRQIRPREDFAFYLVVEIPVEREGISAFECTVEISPDILFTGFSYSPAFPAPLNIGPAWAGDGFLHFVVGGGGCAELTGQPLAIVEFHGVVLAPAENLLVSVGPNQWVSSTEGRAPAWVDCDNDVIYDFAVPSSGEQIAVELQSVSSATASIGVIRALYANGGGR